MVKWWRFPPIYYQLRWIELNRALWTSVLVAAEDMHYKQQGYYRIKRAAPTTKWSIKLRLGEMFYMTSIDFVWWQISQYLSSYEDAKRDFTFSKTRWAINHRNKCCVVAGIKHTWTLYKYGTWVSAISIFIALRKMILQEALAPSAISFFRVQ